MKRQHTTTIYILIVLAVIFWGLSYVWTKVAFTYYAPITVMLIRLTISSVLMTVIFKVRGLGERVDPKDYKAFALLSFFSPFCFFIGENFGVYHVSPTVAAVIIATIPVFSPILGYVAFREKLSVINILGFIISFFGVIVMVMDSGFRFTASPLGIFWLFFAVFSALVNIIYLKKLAVRYSSFTIIRIQNILGAIFFVPVFLVMDAGDFVHIRPSWEAVASLFALAVFGSTLAFMFYTSAVRAIGVARTAIFANLIPVVTAIASYLFLQEIIGVSRIFGMLIVISGLLMTQITNMRRHQRLRKK
ncbi:MAG: DMT family transporter [Bacteroidales bacterium]